MDVLNVDSSHYLYSFSEEELLDILLKPDEWSVFDFELSRKILKERGKDFSPGVLDLIKKRRIEELAKPEPSQSTWIFAGYLFAFTTGVIGALIGWHLMVFKKTLPDGKRVYGHNESDRRHGQFIFVIGTLITFLTILFRATLFSDPGFFPF